MIARVFWLAVSGCLAFAFYYISRFYDLRLWGRDGLFGIEALPPQGGLLAQWLRGTEFAVFELVIWALAVFAILSMVQWVYDRLGAGKD